jgi:hypothetical protein
MSGVWHVFRKGPDTKEKTAENPVAVQKESDKEFHQQLVNIIVPCIVRVTKCMKAGDCPVCGMDLVKAP